VDEGEEFDQHADLLGSRRLRMRYLELPLPSSRGVSRVAAVTAVVVAAGVTAGSAPAVTQQPASLQLSYACAFLAGSRPVSAQITASFPAATKAGQPIRPTGTAITVTLPQNAVAALAGLHASTVTLTTGLSTRVSEGSRSATLIWRNFTSPAMAIPRTGPLRVTTSGVAPGVSGAVAGQVTFAVGGLSLLFGPGPAAGHPAGPSSGPGGVSSGPGGPSAGSASPPTGRGRPVGVQAVCTPRAGQNTTLAQVAVSGSSGATAAVSLKNDPEDCPPPFAKGIKLNPRFPPPKPPKGSHIFNSPQLGCAYVAGFSDVRKLGEAALVGPALTDLILGSTVYLKNAANLSYLQIQNEGKLEFHGKIQFPPARATLLAFGFVPVSATLQLRQIGSLNATFVQEGPGSHGCRPHHCTLTGVTTVSSRLTLRLYDVKVNGVRLNIGSNCHTVTPFDAALKGIFPTYSITTGGPIHGQVTVPPFTGCNGTGENLDVIFSAPVSGPGNFTKLTQGAPCTPVPEGGCDPVVIPKPKR
jgi:hypothetical protein